MFCPKCGKINPDSEEVCSGCGANLHEEQTETPKKSNSKMKIAIALAVVIVLVVIAVLVLNGCNPGNIAEDKVNF